MVQRSSVTASKFVQFHICGESENTISVSPKFPTTSFKTPLIQTACLTYSLCILVMYGVPVQLTDPHFLASWISGSSFIQSFLPPPHLLGDRCQATPEALVLITAGLTLLTMLLCPPSRHLQQGTCLRSLPSLSRIWGL